MSVSPSAAQLMVDTTAHFIAARPSDIVLGKGNGIKFHQGNKELRTIVDAYAWEYDVRPKPLKRAFAQDLAFTVINGPEIPRRVLQSINGTVDSCVEVVDQKTIVHVVMHRLRHGRKERAKACQAQPFVVEMSEKEMDEAILYFLG